MRDRPQFSIILPSYNRPALLARAIASVLRQSFAGWELIIIDDGTLEDQRLALDAYTDPRIRYYWQANSGRGAARNKGLSLANAPYICFLDDDDQFAPNHLFVFQQAIKQNSNTQIFKTGAIAYEGAQKTFESSFLAAQSEREQISYLLNNYFGLLDLCIARKLIGNHQFEKYVLWEDKFFLLPLLQQTRVMQLNHRTLVINEHQQRSVNLAYKDPQVIEDQLNAIKLAFQKFNLKEQYGFSDNFEEKILINILCTHFYHAKKYEGTRTAWQLAKKMYAMHPSIKLYAYFLKYQLTL